MWVNFTVDLCVSRIWLQGQAASEQTQANTRFIAQTCPSAYYWAADGAGLCAHPTQGTAATHAAGHWAEESPEHWCQLNDIEMVFSCPGHVSFFLSSSDSYQWQIVLWTTFPHCGIRAPALLLTNCRNFQVGSFNLSAPYMPHIYQNQAEVSVFPLELWDIVRNILEILPVNGDVPLSQSKYLGGTMQN